ncbi:hypothetical protein ACJZRZ_003362 [Vibrio parahaemolyticus]|nr:hypothetical protein [Vibrio parahaemolyticus]EIU6753247.1 hypothetical protein [Vibrio parahaemolyticus]ELA9881614.1 hypothetical protein [Vibrio parahaemolyticus]
MELKELYDLSIWADEHLNQAGLVPSLSETIKYLQSNNSPMFLAQQSHKPKIINLFEAVPLQALTKKQQSILRKMDIIALLGPNAESYFEGIFGNDHSPKEIATLLAYSRTALSSSIKVFSGFASTLPEVADIDEEKPEIPPGYATLRLTFQGDASISDMSQFDVWGKKWHLISRGFALASGYKTQDFKVIGAGNGSIFLDILSNLETINLIGEATNHLLDIGLKIAEAYGLYSGIKELQKRMPSEEAKTAANPLVKAAKEEFESQKSELYTSVAEKMIADRGTSKEHTAALAKALRELDCYLKQGGDIDLLSIGHDPDSDTNPDDVLKINQQKISESIKELQNNKTLCFLEDKNDEEKLTISDE